MILRLFLAMFLFLISIPAHADEAFNYKAFSKAPILHEGRIKPLGTFARAFLTSMNGKDHIGSISADFWLAELLFDQEKAYERLVFNVPNPDVLLAIGITPSKKHRYSFLELTQAMSPHFGLIEELRQQNPKDISMAQRQLIELYGKTLWYMEISRSVTLLIPDIIIKEQKLANDLGLQVNVPYTYLDLMRNRAQIAIEVQKLSEQDNLTLDQEELLFIGHKLQLLSRDQSTRLLRIIPSQWASNKGEWFSPWQVLFSGSGSPETADYMKTWTNVAGAYLDKDASRWHSAVDTMLAYTENIGNSPVDVKRLSIEVFSNKVDLLQKSLLFYLLSFMALLIGALVWRKPLWLISFWALSFGGVAHLCAILLRVYIMARPPVATLYESILFVGLIAVLFSLILEKKQRQGIGLLVGSVLGVSLQFLGMKYASDGDTMGMLEAVLNTNFWLATHVVSITIGYGACFVAGLIAHIYLVKKLLRLEDKSGYRQLVSNALNVSLVALFFSVLGTILGGIWADQSWGRFWGWDPKENGALFICLWLIWLLHGRISCVLQERGFMVGVAFLNIIVALAWFGVNLLNVGLHSYGFTENIAQNLGLFVSIETVFILIALALGRKSPQAKN